MYQQMRFSCLGTQIKFTVQLEVGLGFPQDFDGDVWQCMALMKLTSHRMCCILWTNLTLRISPEIATDMDLEHPGVNICKYVAAKICECQVSQPVSQASMLTVHAQKSRNVLKLAGNKKI